MVYFFSLIEPKCPSSFSEGRSGVKLKEEEVVNMYKTRVQLAKPEKAAFLDRIFLNIPVYLERMVTFKNKISLHVCGYRNEQEVWAAMSSRRDLLQ